MWESHVEALDDRTLKVSILGNGGPLPYADVLDRWQRDETFRATFISLLAEAPFAAYFWETPPVTEANVHRAFEFVLVDSPPLAALHPDEGAFAGHFESSGGDEGIVAFPNLGRDAFLVAPCPRTAPSAYPHLAAFAREGPEPQQHALWRAVGRALEQRLHDQPIWLSTAGLGVSWVHVRLDSRPKYYSFAPYRDMRG